MYGRINVCIDMWWTLSIPEASGCQSPVTEAKYPHESTRQGSFNERPFNAFDDAEEEVKEEEEEEEEDIDEEPDAADMKADVRALVKKKIKVYDIKK